MSDWKPMTDEEWQQFLANPWMNRNAIDDLRYALLAAAERAERLQQDHAEVVRQLDFEQGQMKLVQADRAALRARAERAEAAIRWALGELDEFPTRGDGQGAYWWRTELRRRAALSPAPSTDAGGAA